MSLMTSVRENGNGNDATSVPPTVMSFAPRQVRLLHELGTTTVQMIDQITDIQAAEIEKVVEEVERKAREIVEGLREYVRQMRSAGAIANERLANFVHFATTCNDAAKMMQLSPQRQDAPPREPPPAQITPPQPTDLPAPAIQ